MLLIATAVAAEVQVVHEAPFELRHVVLDNGLEVFLQPRADSTSVLGLVVAQRLALFGLVLLAEMSAARLLAGQGIVNHRFPKL